MMEILLFLPLVKYEMQILILFADHLWKGQKVLRLRNNETMLFSVIFYSTGLKTKSAPMYCSEATVCRNGVPEHVHVLTAVLSCSYFCFLFFYEVTLVGSSPVIGTTALVPLFSSCCASLCEAAAGTPKHTTSVRGTVP